MLGNEVMNKHRIIFLLMSFFLLDRLGAEPGYPSLLAYEELVQLYVQQDPGSPLQQKLKHLLTTPFVSNAASEKGVEPMKPAVPKLGRVLRVIFWNIERGQNFEAIKWAFTDSARFLSVADHLGRAPEGTVLNRVREQLRFLQQADLIVLTEADWGMERTGYRHVAEELASALDMNYAFGVEFIEIDPFLLGIEDNSEQSRRDSSLRGAETIERGLYKGLHGTAILSRYRLENVRLIPFEQQGYDWYRNEKKGVPPLERAKRALSERVFLEKTHRQVRRGGRMMLMAEISDPDIPTGKALVVATHLEGRAHPAQRAAQVKELLSHIQDVTHPVILAGDMNTSGRDATPTSVRRELTQRLSSQSFWLKELAKRATGFGMLLDLVLGGLSFGRTHADPTVADVPIFARNPEREFFDLLERFRFRDGGAFDFRGEPACAGEGRSGTLANSNERGGKGFVTTLEVPRPLGPSGKFKLDWFFIKPFGLQHPRKRERSCRFAPHFPWTLTELNDSLKGGISDHSPIVINLPLDDVTQR